MFSFNFLDFILHLPFLFPFLFRLFSVLLLYFLFSVYFVFPFVFGLGGGGGWGEEELERKEKGGIVPSDVPTKIAVGVARPRAQGQETT